MKLRVKILFLLLVVSALPVLFSGFLSFLSIQDLGLKLASETRVALLNSAQKRLNEVVIDSSSRITSSIQNIDMAVRVLQENALSVLEHPFKKTSVITTDEFDLNNQSLGDLVLLPGTESAFEGDAQTGQFVSYQFPAITSFGSSNASTSRAQAQQLWSLLPTFSSITISPGLPAMRYFVATKEGVGITYPGHGGMPEDYDPTQRKWFVEGMASAGGVSHLPPSVDASTSKLVATTVTPIINANGQRLGVVGAEQALTELLHMIHLPDDWYEEAVVQIVYPEADSLYVVASLEMTTSDYSWKDHPEIKPFSYESEEFNTLVKALKDRTAGVCYMQNKGIDLFAAFAPIEFNNLALLIWIPHEVIAKEALMKELIVQQETVEHAAMVGLMVLGICIGVVFISSISSRALSKPIVELSKATNAVSEGNYEVFVQNSSQDEIGDLARSFNIMVPQLKERIDMQKTLEIAKQIQQCLLPSETPLFTGWEIAGKCMYCDATGGDYYDFISSPDDENYLRLALGDVTGHGIASALMMATARSLLRGGAKCGNNSAELLNDVNNSLVQDTPLGWFMTFYSMELRADSNNVYWVSAGHDPAVVVDIEGNINELEGDDIPLGVTSGWSFVLKGPAIIPSGSVIVLGTDGIWEARNDLGEMFDKHRFYDVIKQNRMKSVSDICDAIGEAVLQFCGGAPRTDDITMIVARKK